MIFKSSLLREVARTTGNGPDTTKAILDAFFDALVKDLAKGHDVQIQRFGTFTARTVAAANRTLRQGHIHTPQRRTVGFRPSETLKRMIQDDDIA